ncbi:MAG: acylphosphatase [Spirochaetes bacterium]|nr:MAG: acylphosphatase [Spirochaetota bacterium]
MLAKSYIVTGRVQGVGFRWFVLGRARSLDITGWVRNLPDGSVEVRAEGSEAALESLESLLEKGPAGSMVRDVQSRPSSASERYHDFDITY